MILEEIVPLTFIFLSKYWYYPHFLEPPFFFTCDYSYSTDRKFALWQESSQILHDEIDVFTKINLLGGFKNYYLGSTARILRIRCTHCLHVVWLMSNCSLWSTEAVHHCALLKNNEEQQTNRFTWIVTSAQWIHRSLYLNRKYYDNP